METSPTRPTVADLAAHPMIQNAYRRFRPLSARTLADPMLDAAGDEWARTHLDCAPGQVAAALRYLADHDPTRPTPLVGHHAR